MSGSDVVGVLNIDKPQGITSHDVVARIRKLAGIRRVGHAGTLDPLATGVLLVCIGAATRIAEYLQGGRKVYHTRIRLGETTDTYDAEGAVTATAALPALDFATIDAALDVFRGEIQQVPPMYSALKHKGRSLHELARQGIEVERPARTVSIDELVLERWQAPDLDLRITCSTGTYVRSLAHDLGQTLGCGGHVRTLRRLASGPWRAADAIPLDDLLTAGANWQTHLHGLTESLSMLPALALSADLAYRFALGQRLPLPADIGSGDLQVYGPENVFVGIGRANLDLQVLSPHKIFADPNRLL